MDVLVDELRYDRIPVFAGQQECCPRELCHGPIDIDAAGLGEGVEAVGSKHARHSDEQGKDVSPNFDGESWQWRHDRSTFDWESGT